MTTTGRGKVFRRKMWALINPAFIPVLYAEKKHAMDRKCAHRDRVIRVLVTQIRAGRGGKRGRK